MPALRLGRSLTSRGSCSRASGVVFVPVRDLLYVVQLLIVAWCVSRELR
jgi:hypothetical protein